MGKAGEEQLAIAVQKYPCLYDKAILAFHNKNENENAWKAVRKDLGFETGEDANVEQKKTLKGLKNVRHRCRKSNESRKGHAIVSFPQLFGQLCA